MPWGRTLDSRRSLENPDQVIRMLEGTEHQTILILFFCDTFLGNRMSVLNMSRTWADPISICRHSSALLLFPIANVCRTSAR